MGLLEDPGQAHRQDETEQKGEKRNQDCLFYPIVDREGSPKPEEHGGAEDMAAGVADVDGRGGLGPTPVDELPQREIAEYGDNADDCADDAEGKRGAVHADEPEKRDRQGADDERLPPIGEERDEAKEPGQPWDIPPTDLVQDGQVLRGEWVVFDRDGEECEGYPQSHHRRD